MPDIQNKTVIGRIKHIVDSRDNLDSPETRSHVPRIAGAAIEHIITKFGTENLEILRAKTPHILRTIDLIQQFVHNYD